MAVAPAAQRALFQRYHVGGCSSCGFQPSDTLAQVAKDHNVLDINDMVRTIVTAQQLDGKIQIEPADVKSWLNGGEDFSFIDCRTPDERGAAQIEAAEPLDYDRSDKYMSLPQGAADRLRLPQGRPQPRRRQLLHRAWIQPGLQHAGRDRRLGRRDRLRRSSLLGRLGRPRGLRISAAARLRDRTARPSVRRRRGPSRPNRLAAGPAPGPTGDRSAYAKTPYLRHQARCN